MTGISTGARDCTAVSLFAQSLQSTYFAMHSSASLDVRTGWSVLMPGAAPHVVSVEDQVIDMGHPVPYNHQRTPDLHPSF